MQGIQAAVKFSNGDTVYTYKSTLADLIVGEIVAVPRQNGYTMAAVVGVDETPVTIAEGNPIISIRECMVDPATITPVMRNEYRELIRKMKNPSFFEIGLPAEPTDEDKYAVAVRFMNDFTGKFGEQEYTYLTNNTQYNTGDLVVVPTGVFNLPKRASVVRYVPYPKDLSVKLKRVHGRPLELAKKSRA